MKRKRPSYSFRMAMICSSVRDEDRRPVPQAWDQRGELLQLEDQIRRLEVSEAKRLKGLESEDARLKKLLADAMLDNAALKDLLAKKW